MRTASFGHATCGKLLPLNGNARPRRAEQRENSRYGAVIDR
jgi:hypothetical protein